MVIEDHLPELVAGCGLLLVLLAEFLHHRRARRIAYLTFGPKQRPAAWVPVGGFLKACAVAAVAWGLLTLIEIPPKVHRVGALPEGEPRHLLLVLDVSPSMKLEDAGPDQVQSRRGRAADLLGSFFDRVAMDFYRVSVVAVYNGAKPVVIDTRDFEVVENILDELPMEFAFTNGKTKLLDGLEEAARIARPWKPASTIVVLMTDGDTVPATGMPRMPAAVKDVLVVGVGDTRTGKFLNGRHSRQDASTLRQIAMRLRGTYHDGNEKHIPTDVLRRLTDSGEAADADRFGKREYALLAVGLGSAWLAFLPWLLTFFGTGYRPGVPLRGTSGTPGGSEIRRQTAGPNLSPRIGSADARHGRSHPNTLERTLPR